MLSLSGAFCPCGSGVSSEPSLLGGAEAGQCGLLPHFSDHTHELQALTAFGCQGLQARAAAAVMQLL